MSYLLDQLRNSYPSSKAEFDSIYSQVSDEKSRLLDLAREANHTYNNHEDQKRYGAQAHELQEAFNDYDSRVGHDGYQRLP